MMEWFRRHLNWTAVFAPLVAGLLGIAIVRTILLATGMLHIPFPGSPYPYDFKAIVALANIMAIICLGWVLKRKNRKLWYLAFLVPPFIPSSLPVITLAFLMTFWLAGWIIVLALKNNSE